MAVRERRLAAEPAKQRVHNFRVFFQDIVPQFVVATGHIRDTVPSDEEAEYDNYVLLQLQLDVREHFNEDLEVPIEVEVRDEVVQLWGFLCSR